MSATPDNISNAGAPAARSGEPEPEPANSVSCKSKKPPPISPGTKFEPNDLEDGDTPIIHSGLPDEIWTIVQSAPATFPPQFFLDVSRNLVENPNITANHLSRAEISYSSFTDATYNPTAKHPHDLAKIVKHLKSDHQPLLVEGGVPGYELQWTVVRKLVPRNPKVDNSLMQTCHLFTSNALITISHVREGAKETQEVQAERYLIIYLPHVSTPSEIPFYHPTVKALAILYTYFPTLIPSTSPLPTQGHLSLYYTLFPEHPLDNRLSRTALHLLQTIHKHSNGRMNGYTKRVQHDVIVPQKTFGDLYAYLKGKYAKELIEGWVEQTPAEKHVFEDLGIAAFLMGLWGDMYGGDSGSSKDIGAGSAEEVKDIDGEENEAEKRLARAKQNFPGFIDIGCGNGLLVYILNLEGWAGTGFDARARKTWETFPASISANLSVQLLVPEILNTDTSSISTIDSAIPLHNGIFRTGTFLIANHADELTIWTPLLATLSDSPFIAIPCCSHTFSGARFRAPHRADASTPSTPSTPGPTSTTTYNPTPKNSSKQVSAYASFCSYMTHLTTLLGWHAEKEFLRIPSTRNVAVVGRRRGDAGGESKGKGLEWEDRMEYLRGVVEREMGGVGMEEVRREWLERGSGLMKPGKGGGH